jgi:pantoate ligase / CMP/dCMP kinase
VTVIAIDGPSGSGKSTIARCLAETLDLPYLDTGAMYRVVGLVALRNNVNFDDDTALAQIVNGIKMELLDERSNGKLKPRVLLDSVDVTTDIRGIDASQAASAVAVHPSVRVPLVQMQRDWITTRGGGVAEGRDVGTVVFPNADLKVFLTASEDERAKRRQNDSYSPAFSGLSSREVERQMAERDQRDSTRAASPLVAADDALVIDTDGRSIDEIVKEITTELRRRCDAEIATGAVE